MIKTWLSCIGLCLAGGLLQAAGVDEFTPEEAALAALLKARAAQTDPDHIPLPQATKQQALDEHKAEEAAQQTKAVLPANAAPVAAQEPVAKGSPLPAASAPTAPQEPAAKVTPLPATTPKPKVPSTGGFVLPVSPAAAALLEDPASATQDPEDSDCPVSPKEKQKCLTIAFVDIDEAFSQHPRTVAVKEQIHLKIISKEQEVDAAKQIIQALELENHNLTRLLKELKPFYQTIAVQPELAPRIVQTTDTLFLSNLLNQMCFSRCEIITTSPLNTPAQVEEMASRISSNKKIIAERSFFIDNYKYTTREEILKLEEQEVKEILKDIYTELRSFAKKRNVGALVRKDDVLYGEKPVNVTKDFINRLKKSKKYRKTL